MMNYPGSKIFLRIGFAALIVRFLYFFQHTASPFFGRPLLDQHYYHLCARQLAGAGGDLIDGFRPLLYPLFLSCFYRMNLDGGMLISLITQHLLGIGMALMVTWLAAKLFKSTAAGIAAGLLFCLSGPPLYFEGELLITTLFSFLLLLLWICLYAAASSAEPRKAVLLWLTAGIVLGLAVQARPNALPLLLLFPIISIFRAFQKPMPVDSFEHPDAKAGNIRPPKAAALLPLAALVGILGVQLAFGLLNARYSGQFSLMTQAGGINLYLGNSENADGMIPKQSRHVSYEGEYRDPIQVMAVEEYRSVTGTTGPVSQKKVSDFWKKRTIEDIKADPLRWGRLMLKKSWLIFWNHEVPNNRSYTFTAHQETPMLRWLPVRWWLLLILLPWGITALCKREQKEAILWILGYLALFSGTLVLFFVNSRFRIPLWPGMAVVAGGGLHYLWSSLKKRTLPMGPAIASGVLLMISGINWFGIPPDPVENDLSMRAIAYSEQGRYDEALPDILQCIEYAPYNPRYHFIHGNVLMGSGNNVDSINAYLTAISLDPSDPAFHCNLGVALENSNQEQKAEQAYRKAIQVQPDYKAAQINLALLLIRQGRTEQAQPLLAQLLHDDPQNRILLCSEAVLRFKVSNDPAALKRANDLHPYLAKQLLERHQPGND